MKKAFYIFFIILLFFIPFIISFNNSKITTTDKLKDPSVVTDKSDKKNFFKSLFSGGWSKPKLSIILDDAGNDIPYIDKVMLLDRSITIACLPYIPGIKTFAENFTKKGFPVIAHIPMEPFDESKMPAKDIFLLIKDSSQILKIKMDLYIDQNLPFVRGCNNHMGSAFSSDTDSMMRFVQILKEKKLFFIDSSTSETSVAFHIMQQEGIPSFKNKVFLDNKTDLDSIKNEFEKGIKIAQSKGKALIIGHITVEHTIDVLLEKISEYKSKVNFVPALDVLE